MRRRADFTAAIQRGRRASTPRLVVHLAAADPADSVDPAGHPADPLVGFVVSRSVGGAVERNRVKRRLRGLVREHLTGLPVGSRVVVRALPAAAHAPYRDLQADLDRALRSAARGAR
jgi:ribonuclease P protein component